VISDEAALSRFRDAVIIDFLSSAGSVASPLITLNQHRGSEELLHLEISVPGGNREV
jgi:hypothetical protein